MLIQSINNELCVFPAKYIMHKHSIAISILFIVVLEKIRKIKFKTYISDLFVIKNTGNIITNNVNIEQTITINHFV